MKKMITDTVKNISLTALKLMYYGTACALGITVIGVLSYLAYIICLGGGYYTLSTCVGLIKAGVGIFVLFMIGGIIFDCVEKRMG